MENIVDYILSTKNLSFDESPITEVDSLVLSELSYYDFEGVVPALADGGQSVTIGDAAKVISEKHSQSKQDFLNALAESKRFKSLKLSNYSSETDALEEKQFAAMTIEIDEDSTFVSFRGTDNSLTGWKEDFNMAYMQPTPTQKTAVEYLQKVASQNDNQLILGGHSKGGNSALYSSLNSSDDVRERIAFVFNFDGPGMLTEVSDSVAYLELKDRIYNYVPQMSIIGLLLNDHETYQVIKSNGENINQHDPFTWQISENSFIECELEPISAYLNETIDEWLFSLNDSSRIAVVDFIGNIMVESKAENFDQVMELFSGSDFQKTVKVLVDSYSELESNQKADFLISLSGLVLFACSEAGELGQKYIEDKLNAALRKTADILESVIISVKDMSLDYKKMVMQLFLGINAYCAKTVNKINSKLNSSAPSVSSNNQLSEFKVDTWLMRDYANRLRAIRKRMDRVEERVAGLHNESEDYFNILAILRLLSIGDTVLKTSVEYLSNTADDFEGAERKITSILR